MSIGITIGIVCDKISSILGAIASLFNAGEQGVVFDPSDLSSMFQDSAGTTPVTAAGQPVGRINDLSGNGHHATQPTAAKRPTYGIHPFGGIRNLLTQTENFADGVWGKIGVTVTANTDTAPDGTLTADLISGGGNWFSQTSSIGGVAGQTVTASVWVKGAPGVTTVTVRIDRVGIAQGNAVAKVINDSGFTRITHTATLSADAATPVMRLDLSGGNVIVWGAQLEEGTTATAYQKVVTQYEVTEAGVPSVHYLSFDGVDDALATPSIDFTATDEMTVFAGVRKLTGTTPAIILELSGNGGTNVGAFYVAAPLNSTTKLRYLSGGSTFAFVDSSTAAPDNSNTIVTGLSEINPAGLTLRALGQDEGVSAATQGTGNYGNYPLYLGSRGGNTLYFYGNLYGLTVRGKTTVAADVDKAETAMAKLTGVIIVPPVISIVSDPVIAATDTSQTLSTRTTQGSYTVDTGGITVVTTWKDGSGNVLTGGQALTEGLVVIAVDTVIASTGGTTLVNESAPVTVTASDGSLTIDNAPAGSTLTRTGDDYSYAITSGPYAAGSPYTFTGTALNAARLLILATLPVTGTDTAGSTQTATPPLVVGLAEWGDILITQAWRTAGVANGSTGLTYVVTSGDVTNGLDIVFSIQNDGAALTSTQSAIIGA